MRSIPALVLLLGAGCASVRMPPPAAPIAITATVPAPPEAPVTVTMEGEFGSAASFDVRCAPSVVGAYRPFRFGPFIGNLRAWDRDGAPLAVEGTGEGRWRIQGPLARLAWEVDAARTEREIGDLNASIHRRDGHTMLSGYATHLIVAGAERRPYSVRYEVPEGWRVATSLPQEPDGTYRAAHVLELLDEPAMLGTRFRSVEVPHPHVPSRVHVFEEAREAGDRLLQRLVKSQQLAASAVAALGWPALSRPYHVFFEVFTPRPGVEYGWALEHGHSFQGCDRFESDLSLVTSSDRLAYHVTHHVLHAWLPRRLFTDRLDPWRQLEGDTSGFVWFAEGFAQYLAFVGLARAGAVPRERVLEMLVSRFAGPAQHDMPAAPASLTALSEAIGSGDHALWRNHYALGGLFALQLDQELAAAGRPRLNEALLGLFDRHPGGVAEVSFETAFTEAAGLDVRDLFARHVRGTAPPPLYEILEPLGVDFSGGRAKVRPEPTAPWPAQRLRDHLFSRPPE